MAYHIHDENRQPVVPAHTKSNDVPAHISINDDAQLEHADPELYMMLAMEKKRQIESIELIASENFTSRAVRECLASCATNKYSEGRPGLRYYGGNEVIDLIENLCQDRALEAFNCNKDAWSVNVQPLSGSPANLAVFLGLLNPGDKVMGLALPDGGHLSHGFSTIKDPKFTAGAAFFKCKSYHVDPVTGEVDYEQLREAVLEWRPKLLIAGGSAYPREFKWSWFRELADEVGAYLLVDMAHISGLVAAGVHASPFPYADVVSTTTHKSLRGPRSAMVFVNHERLGKEVADAVHKGIFPGVQGGPHNHQIAALAAQLKEVMTDEFRDYQTSVIHNAKVLAGHFTDNGYSLVSGGTDTHLLVVDVRKSKKVTGSKVEFICELCNISLNKNTVPGDKSPLSPSGIRIGTPAMTSRGCSESDMRVIYELLDAVISLTVEVQNACGDDKTLKTFKRMVAEDSHYQRKIEALKNTVIEFSRGLRIPGSQIPV